MSVRARAKTAVGGGNISRSQRFGTGTCGGAAECAGCRSSWACVRGGCRGGEVSAARHPPSSAPARAVESTSPSRAPCPWPPTKPPPRHSICTPPPLAASCPPSHAPAPARSPPKRNCPPRSSRCWSRPSPRRGRPAPLTGPLAANVDLANGPVPPVPDRGKDDAAVEDHPLRRRPLRAAPTATRNAQERISLQLRALGGSAPAAATPAARLCWAAAASWGNECAGGELKAERTSWPSQPRRSIACW